MMGLTHQQAACLEAIKRLTKDGIPPSLAEIERDMGLASKSGVHRMLTALEERGYISRHPRLARSIEVLPTREERGRTASLHNMSTADLRAHVEEGLAILRERES